MRLLLGQVADWIHAEGDFTTSSEALGYSIDSRTVAAGDLFFAVKGERVDGHDYVETALANGAVAAVVSNRWLAPATVDSCRLLYVPESEDCVLAAMQTLAARVREQWGGQVIGVTGSAGKTTTKEMIATVLASRFRVLKSAGNLNNHFGVPLQLLRLEPGHDVAVIEMGMNHAGEIRRLCEIARPDWGVVSNVAAVHLEFFPEGIAGIAAAKRELIEALPSDGLAFLNGDDVWVREFGAVAATSEAGPPLAAKDGKCIEGRVVLFGLGADAQVRAEEVAEAGLDGVRFLATAGSERVAVRVALLGRHNVHNALAAMAVGWKSGMTLAACAAALGEMRAPDKRGSVLQWRGATLVNDCYNSNPRALQAMVEALRAMPVGEGGRRIVIAGEMLELGPEGPALHRECGRAMGGIDAVLGVRGLAKDLVEGAREAGLQADFVESPKEAGAWLQAQIHAGDAVLLKASRGVKLEIALETTNKK